MDDKVNEKSLLAIFIGLFVFAVFVVTVLVILGISSKEEMRLAQERQAQVTKTKAQLQGIVSTEGRFKLFLEEPENDIWGTEIHAQVGFDSPNVHGQPPVIKSVSVVSAGSDKEFGTEDDIHVTKSVLNWNSVGKRFGLATKDFIKGALGK